MSKAFESSYVNYSSDPFSDLELVPFSKFKASTEIRPQKLYFDPDDVAPEGLGNSVTQNMKDFLSEYESSKSSTQKKSISDIFDDFNKRVNSNKVSSTTVDTTTNNNMAIYQPMKASEAQGKIITYLTNKGLSKEAIAGIVGNLYAESKLNTGAIGDGKTSGGIAQWHDKRFTNLKIFAKRRGKDWRDLDTQLDFMWSELNTTYKGVLNGLKSATSAEKAAEIWGHDYEVFKGYNNLNHQRYQERRGYAKQIYKALG